MERLSFFLTLFLSLASVSPLPTNQAWGGNRIMVEQSVQKLDQLNRKLLAQETQIPKNGRLELKADARYGAGGEIDLKVYSRKFSTIAEEPIRFNGKQTPMPSN